jgi:DNA-binding CsgD family transcriptional regulator
MRESHVENAGTLGARNSAVAEFAVRHGLSERERQILQLITSGVHPKAVSGQIGCGYASVRTHLRRIYKKVGCSGNQELLALVISAACE